MTKVQAPSIQGASANQHARPRARGPRPTRRRSGFTLFEVLLTTCLLATIAALAWPTMEKSFATQRLRKAADQIRTQWTKARLDAIESGRARAFTYTPEGNEFQIEQDTSDPLVSDGVGMESSGEMQAAQAPRKQVLPDGVTFLSTQPDTAQAAPPPSGMLGGAMETAGNGMSPPTYFWPDGTCTDTRLVLRNDKEMAIELSLRGLTGIATVGEPTRLDRMLP